MVLEKTTARSLLHLIGLLTGVMFTVACVLPGTGQPQIQPSPTANPGLTESPIQVTPVPTEIATQISGGASTSEILLEQSGAVSASQNSRIELSLDGRASEVLSIETKAANPLAYNLHLVDPFGNFIASVTADSSLPSQKINEVSLPYDGTYGILVSPVSGDGTVDVIVSSLNSSSGGGKLDGFGASASGQMSAPHVFHTYQFLLTQNQVVDVTAKANAPGSPDTSIVLYGPDGHYLTEADDANVPDNLDALITGFTAPLDGTYTAIVTDKGSTTGTYTFQVSDASSAGPGSQPADIVYDTEYRAGLFDGSNLSVTFDATIGDVFKIDTFSPEPGVTSDIYLYSPANQIVAFAVSTKKGSGVDINEAQAAYTGRYRLEFRPVGSGQISFKVTRLQQSDLTGGGVFSDGPTASLPGKVVASNVFHFYQFTAKAGDRISLAAFSVSKGGALDLGFALLGPAGNQVVFADDSQGDFPKDPELNDFEIPQTGTYTVVVYSFTPAATGTYDLVLTRK